MISKTTTAFTIAVLFSANGFGQQKTNRDSTALKGIVSLNNDQPDPGLYAIQKIAINSAYSDFGPAFYLDKLVFASGKRNIGKNQLRYKDTGEYLTDLYIADLNNNFPGKSRDFPGLPQVKTNESTPVFTGDGKTMYFTRNSSQKNEKGITTLKICRASLIDGKWKNIAVLPFNGDNFNTANPALSPDGTTLYFSSDRPGTFGYSDIFKVKINSDGTYGIPENLGPAINTPQRDSFPFVSDENILYFASQGHTGRGGFDIFSSKIMDETTYGPVLNMGPVINSSADDFSMVFNSKEKIGFFASGRDGGKGGDDIYRFTKNKENQIQDAPEVIPADENAIAGNINSQNPEKGQLEELTPASPLLDNAVLPEVTVQRLYFDFQKEGLKLGDQQTQKTLASILEIVSLHPGAVFKIEGHCDNTGQETTNQLISEKRAQNVQKQLIRMGVGKDAIILVKGYGESKPIETNRSPQGRSLNRRVEVIALPAKNSMQ